MDIRKNSLQTPEDVIIRSLQNSSTAEEERQLNEWLHEDEAHVALFCQLQELWNTRNRITSEETSCCWSDLQRRIESRQQKQAPLQRLVPLWIHYAAAALIGVMVASSVWLSVRPHTITEKTVVRNVIHNRTGVQKVELPDRSVVWLQNKGKLTYPETFENNKRMVSLEGNAFFEIAKDPSMPFVVQTENIHIQVTGTAFSVCSEGDSLTVVTLVSGGVDINRINESGQTTAFVKLKPGEQATFGTQTAEIAVNNVNTDYYTAWKDGTYRFTNETLENIVRQLEYHYGIQIRLSPKMRHKRFTGGVAPEHTIRDVLDIIGRTHPVRYRITKTVVYINE
ncbi:MAG: FecR domain-containing protein [Tannerella sp.]|jgi:ferric-dicitrate binding protein FerR (iron transport regulator)|nr:FecR domain-containing protein [Tannerella sp.]